MISKRKRLHSSVLSSDTIRDCLIVSSFGFWAVLLGFFPVLAYHGLLGH